MRYFTFKHKLGKYGSADESKTMVEWAIRLNCAFMQYEYGKQDGYQDKRMVSTNWGFIKDNLNEGDILFLRGDQRIYAVGKIIKPKKPATVTLKMDDILRNRSHIVNGNDYRSGEYDGCIHFEDCPIFYEDFSGNEDLEENLEADVNSWGQRVDVDGWKYYYPDGIPCQASDYYIGGTPQGVLLELEPKQAMKFIKQLEEKFMGQELKLLEENKNLILSGAPGTGKTFLARELALKLIFAKDGLLTAEEEAAFKKQCRFVQFHPSYDYTDFVEGLRPTDSSDGGSIGFELRDGTFKKFCKDAIPYSLQNEPNYAKFVFIIDEINRGEISKIFGELFFSIDPDYRGEKGKVQTQYANMLSDEDPFKDGFFVPENVYIIGTMNDIDRSVESFDFAMRRRFVWHEITAEESAKNMKLPEPIVIKMKALNSAISNVPGLNSSYHIGAAYFLNKKDKDSAELDYGYLWKFQLKPLLKEYLRGMPNSKEQLGKLHAAFDNSYNGDPEE